MPTLYTYIHVTYSVCSISVQITKGGNHSFILTQASNTLKLVIKYQFV